MSAYEKMIAIQAECISADNCAECKYYDKQKYKNFGCPWKTADMSAPQWWNLVMVGDFLEEGD